MRKALALVTLWSLAAAQSLDKPDPCLYKPCPLIGCDAGQTGEMIPGTEGNCCGGTWRCVGEPTAERIIVDPHGCEINLG